MMRGAARALASGFGSSFPFARGARRLSGAGTAGAAVGLLLWPLLPHGGWPLGAILCVSLPVAAWSIETAHFEHHDDPRIVIDEVLGMWWTLAFLPRSLPILFAGFFLFRLLDVWKPGPIRVVQRWPGALGVMADDLLAGILANLILRLGILAVR